MKIRRALLVPYVLFLLTLVNASSIAAQAEQSNEQESYFESLRALCQQTFSG